MEETDTTRGLESPPLEGSGKPSQAGHRPVPATPSFVYALGQIEPRFPSLAVEKEFVQGTGRADAAGLTDREALHAVLSDRANRYLARQLCWVFEIEGLETYLLAPRDPADLELLVEAVRPRPNPTDIDVVIGVRGPLALPEACNGLVLPVVTFDQLYSFDCDALLGAIPRPEDVPERRTSDSGQRRRNSSTGSCRWRTTPEPPTSTAP